MPWLKTGAVFVGTANFWAWKASPEVYLLQANKNSLPKGEKTITNLLLRIFVPNYKKINSENCSEKERLAFGKLVGAVSITVNILLSGAKLAMGAITGSIAITADAINNIFDVTAGVITFIGFKMAARPADKEHPYGHARIEYISGLIIAILIFIVGFELIQSSFLKILNPEPVRTSLVAIIILAMSVIAKLWLMHFSKVAGAKISSETLKATATDCRNDALSTTAVLLSLVIAHFTSLNLDGFMGLLVALFIIYSAVGILKDVTDPLLGKAPSAEFTQYILAKILKHDTILGAHDLIVHDYGQSRRFGSVHVEISTEVDPIESHQIIDDIERDFLESDNMIFVIHYDPVLVGDEAVQAYRNTVTQALNTLSPLLSIHDFRVVDNKSYVNVIFDVEVPYEFDMKDDEIKEKIQELVKNEDVKINTMVTIDRVFV